MVDRNVGGLSPLRGPLATGAADRKYTDIAARVARVLLKASLPIGIAGACRPTHPSNDYAPRQSALFGMVTEVAV
jgi:hypothetical protein